jgi:hypothetical protein
MEDDIKALREEIAKLRERVAVLEAAKAAPLNLINSSWGPALYSDQHMPTFQSVPPGSPYTITG